ncbi:hypothetical protein YC2023_116024 [Brassica napus]
MKFPVFFVMFFLFLICFTTAQTLIQDSRKKAAAKDPLFKYDFCVQSLETDPHSKAATNLKGLLIASTKNAEFNTIKIYFGSPDLPVQPRVMVEQDKIGIDDP